MNLLTTENLCIAINKKILFKDLNITFKSGEIWGILGRNGVGKTTLLHTLATLRQPESGQIYLQDLPIENYSIKERARKLALLLQTYEDHFQSNVLETVLMGRHPHRKHLFWESAEDIHCAREALATVGLSHVISRDIKSLSGGERRRVDIAMTIAQKPLVFLLDEPTNHLDIHYQMNILNYFHELVTAKGHVVMMTLHDINHAAKYCTHILLLGEKQYFAGPKESILTSINLTQIYGHEILHLDHKGNKYWFAL
jgi:iron complex transport system ATP-binding protein